MDELKLELQKLSQYITENKWSSIQKVIANRTRHLTVVLEDVRQSQNSSAVIRSCDCFGVQDLHVIENQHKFDVNRKIVQGSSKWVDVYRYNSLENNTNSCLTKLKKEGYKIVATTPHKDDYPIQQLPLDEKVALVIGSEGYGISEEVKAQADYFTQVPMYGFTESLNLSVCTALCLNQIITRLHDSEISWELTEIESLELQLKWVKQVMKKSSIYDNKIEV